MIRDKFTSQIEDLAKKQSDAFNNNESEDRRVAIQNQIEYVLEQRKKHNDGGVTQ